MSMIKFAIIGSGFRAEFYLRIARYYCDKYEICGVLCRSEEKAQTIGKKYKVKATINEQEILKEKPDFIVVAVSKASIYEVSSYWRKLGFTVLCETPVALKKEMLEKIYEGRNTGGKLVIAEQYQYYPTYKKIIDTVKSGKIGEVLAANVSIAHEYHGASLIREILGEDSGASYSVLCTKYDMPVTKTKDRYESFYDGEVINRSRAVAMVEFENGKIATYDFDSEQYRSTIRHNSVKITGVRGEIMNEKIWYLNDQNKEVEGALFDNLQKARNASDGSGLSEDETAIEYLLDMTYKVSQGEELLWQENNLKNALADAYFMAMLNESKGQWIKTPKMPW